MCLGREDCYCLDGEREAREEEARRLEEVRRPPEVAWVNESWGVRAVSFLDEEDRKRVLVIEVRDSRDAMGVERWTRIDRSNKTHLRRAVRGMVDILSPCSYGDELTYLP